MGFWWMYKQRHVGNPEGKHRTYGHLEIVMVSWDEFLGGWRIAQIPFGRYWCALNSLTTSDLEHLALPCALISEGTEITQKGSCSWRNGREIPDRKFQYSRHSLEEAMVIYGYLTILPLAASTDDTHIGKKGVSFQNLIHSGQ